MVGVFWYTMVALGNESQKNENRLYGSSLF